MSTLERIARCGALAGFLFVSSGCVVAPDRGYDHDRDAREQGDHRDHDERHCDEHDRDCHEAR